jgi:hypothetical protein
MEGKEPLGVIVARAGVLAMLTEIVSPSREGGILIVDPKNPKPHDSQGSRYRGYKGVGRIQLFFFLCKPV